MASHATQSRPRLRSVTIKGKEFLQVPVPKPGGSRRLQTFKNADDAQRARRKLSGYLRARVGRDPAATRVAVSLRMTRPEFSVASVMMKCQADDTKLGRPSAPDPTNHSTSPARAHSRSLARASAVAEMSSTARLVNPPSSKKSTSTDAPPPTSIMSSCLPTPHASMS
jgi:hypothetical protein